MSDLKFGEKVWKSLPLEKLKQPGANYLPFTRLVFEVLDEYSSAVAEARAGQ